MKKTIMRTLAMALALVMVLGMLPAGLLSFTAAAATETIYVATTGSDATGDGSQANPYATIQKAVNAVPDDNTVPTTILIADGVYNVYVDMDSANDIKSDDLGHTLIVNKDNVTLKAQNKQKVVIYGYVDAAEAASLTLKGNEARYKVLLTVHLEDATNVTLDGLVVLPTFWETKWPTDTTKFVTSDLTGSALTNFRTYVETYVPGGIADFADKDHLYYDGGGNEVLQAGAFGASGKLYNLTIQNCVIGANNVMGGIRLGGKLLGEYHIENNTIRSISVVQKAGNEAENPCTITGNTITSGMTITGSKADYNNPPVIRGNTFTANSATTRYYDSTTGLSKRDLKQTVIIRGSGDAGNSPYTDGEWSVIAQANTFNGAVAYTHATTASSETGAASSVDTLLGLVSGFTNIKGNAYSAPVEDTSIDTEEELAYWMTLAGDLTLAGDITVTKNILPQDVAATVIFGTYKITKAANLDIPAPAGYTWLDNTTLVQHTHAPSADWTTDGTYHWNACTALVNGEACTAKLNKEAHELEADDHSCLTAEKCTICLLQPNQPQAAHCFDNDCTTADECQNPGCTQRAAGATFHTFTDGSDTSCNIPGCTYTRDAMEGIVIYVATTGNDETADGSAANPYATIQMAVNAVPSGNTVPTTILIADGAYNVYVAPGSAGDVKTSDDYGHGLVIAKSNLTLKAQNPQKVVIFGYAEATISLHEDHSVMRIRNSKNLTFDGLVILPLFAKSMSATSNKPSINATEVNALLRSFLDESLADQVVGNASGKVYYSTARAMIVTNKWGNVSTNTGVTATSGLTFKDCYLNPLENDNGPIKVQAGNNEGDTFTGDYHFIGNTIVGHLTIVGAGNGTTVQSEIRNNIIISTSTTGSSKKISITGDVEKLPVIEGNVFKSSALTIGDGQSLIVNSSTAARYTTGELAVMALTNSVANTNIYCNLKYDGQKIAVTSEAPDTTIDTQEELVHWLKQTGNITLGGNIVITKNILPNRFTASLIFGEFSVTKAAELDIPAPEGYTWLYGTTLTAHTHAPETEWTIDGDYHWYACATDGCYEKLDKADHALVDDYNCTTAEVCSVCLREPRAAQAAHVFDADCTSDDKCQNPGCAQMAGKNEFHIFTDRRDATCNAPGCTYERVLLKEDVIYVATTGNDVTGDGSMERPFATIQRAVNDVPGNNSVPTTILIADGAYNVYVEKGSDNDAIKTDNYGHNLMIAKSNLTIKAQNKQKVVIYGYSEAALTANSYHTDGHVVNIRNSQNVTFDGLVFLPHFVSVTPTGLTNTAVDAATVNALVKSFLGESAADVIDEGTAATLYFISGNSLIRANSYTATSSNGTLKSMSGLTFQYCYLNTVGTQAAIELNSHTNGDYHIIGNTFKGDNSSSNKDMIVINGAGNDATVQSEIRNNKIIGNRRSITIKGSLEKLPVIKGNTFEGAWPNTASVIVVSSELKYTTGEMAVMALTNSLNQTGVSGTYLKYTAGTIAVTDDENAVDNSIDTEEELFYWLTEADVVTLKGNIELTEALPESENVTLVLDGFTVTKPASMYSPAPEGFCWVTSLRRDAVSTLAPHSWSATYVPENQNGVTAFHFVHCTNCLQEQAGTREACVPEVVADGDYDCTVAIRCTLCNGVNVPAKASHRLGTPVKVDSTYHQASCSDCDQIITTAHESAGDGDCLTADVCICGHFVREAKDAHSYKQLKRDTNGHWYQCEWCESTTEVEAHTGGTATCAMRASCDVCYKEYGQLNPENHTFTNYVSDNNATCEVNGTKTAVCDGCAAATDTVVDLDAIPSHNFEGQAWKASEDGHYKECVNFANCGTISEKVAHIGGSATCSEQAKCETCGASYGEMAADVHSFTNYVSNGDATCLADGTKTAVCDWCATATDTVADIDSILDHSYTNYVSDGNATCLADGTETAICDNGCDGTVTRRAINSALGHSFTNYEPTGDATCLADGTKTAVCDNCLDAISVVADPGSALGHSFTKFVNDNNATCTANGTKTAICNNGCGSTKTMVAAGSATGHNFEGKELVADKNGHWVRCECGEKSMAEHTPVVIGEKKATTSDTGYTGDTVCEVCEYQIAKGEIISKLPTTIDEGLSDETIALIVFVGVTVFGFICYAGYWFLLKKKS